MVKDLKELDVLIKDLGKKFGEGSVFIMGDKKEISNVERWPLSSLVMNEVTGGGLPKGRIIEIFGNESHGKTSIACYLAGQVQEQGGVVAFIDAENGLDISYAKTLGFDTNKCIFNQPDNGEQALEVAVTLAESGKVDLIIVDSVAALTPKAEIEGEMTDQQMGALARLMGKGCRKLTSILGKTKTTIIFTNQNREAIGIMFGDPTRQPGGRALKFFSSIRLQVSRKEFIETGANEDKTSIGIITKIKAVKNKVGTPMKFGNIKILFGKGISVEEEYIDYALSLDILQRKGTWYFFDGVSLGQGKEKAIEYFKSNSSVYDLLKKTVKNRLEKITVNIEKIQEDGVSEGNSEFESEEKTNELLKDQENATVSEIFDVAVEEPKKRGRKARKAEDTTLAVVIDEDLSPEIPGFEEKQND